MRRRTREIFRPLHERRWWLRIGSGVALGPMTWLELLAAARLPVSGGGR